MTHPRPPGYMTKERYCIECDSFACPHLIRAQVLTSREIEILRAVAEGRTNKRIAEAMQISEGTLKVYLSRIYMKLFGRSKEWNHRARLVGWAYEHPWVSGIHQSVVMPPEIPLGLPAASVREPVAPNRAGRQIAARSNHPKAIHRGR